MSRDDGVDAEAGPSVPSTTRSASSRPVLNETWTQVDELPDADDSDFSGEEETTYITLDFGPDIPADLLSQVNTFQLTSLNSQQPWAKIGTDFLRGQHERTLGSDILFIQPPVDPDSGRAPHIEPVATTHSRVRFEKVVLTPKYVAGEKQTASAYLLQSGRGSRGGKSAAAQARRNAEEVLANGAVAEEDVDANGVPPVKIRRRGRGGRRGNIPTRGGRGRRKSSAGNANARDGSSAAVEEQDGEGTPSMLGEAEAGSQLAAGGDLDMDDANFGRTIREQSPILDVEEF